MGNIGAVENIYGHAQRTTVNQGNREIRGGGQVLRLCEKNDILIPFFSLMHSIVKS